MARYLAKRLLQAVVVLWAAYSVSFLVLYALPADPVQLLAGADASDVSAEQLEALREVLHDQRLVEAELLTQRIELLRAHITRVGPRQQLDGIRRQRVEHEERNRVGGPQHDDGLQKPSRQIPRHPRTPIPARPSCQTDTFAG